jgi:hypothetical protein
LSFDCIKCNNPDWTDEEQKDFKTRQGCYGKRRRTFLEGTELEVTVEECPWKCIDADFEIIEVFNHYEKGHLPEPGSVMDQPAVTMEALSHIGRVMDLKLEEKIKANEQDKTSIYNRWKAEREQLGR